MRLYNRINRQELKRRMMESGEKRITISFYRYYSLGNPHLFRDHLYCMLDQVGVLGRIYIAKEGINAQISIPEKNLNSLKECLNTITFLENVRLNIAIEDNGKSFFKLKIVVRDKIVADGLDDSTFDVTKRGKHLSAAEWNNLADQPGSIIVDMRNHYESEVGHFKNAICPDVETFREELPLVAKMFENQKDKPILMYCTGGIRCEKASAYMIHQGYQQVYMLDGGIIEYARQVKEQNLENKFMGKNFVFDERLGEKITEDIISHCHQCGNPCDTHVNCANDACHILFIQCEACSQKMDACCSEKCKNFNQLDEQTRIQLRKTTEFNGTKFGKGRYKAFKKNEMELV